MLDFIKNLSFFNVFGFILMVFYAISVICHIGDIDKNKSMSAADHALFIVADLVVILFIYHAIMK